MNDEKLDKEDCFLRVYEIVKKIPSGKVTTYGIIAKEIGLKSSAIMVGWALNAVRGYTEIPCHRVVNRNGYLTGKMHFLTPTLMRELLEQEGINFIGEQVDLAKHLWVPNSC